MPSHLSRPSVGSMAWVNNHALSNFLSSCISLMLCPYPSNWTSLWKKSHKYIAKAHFKLMTTNLKRTCRTTRSFNATPLVNSLSHSSRALFHTVSSHSSASLPHSYLTVRIDIIRGEPLIFSAPVLEPTDTCTHTLCLNSCYHGKSGTAASQH